MRFLFIDEIQQTQRNQNFFGIGIFAVDAFHYQDLVDNFTNRYNDCGWNPEIEFKGKYLFSRSGDGTITIDERILLVDSMADKTTAKKNAKAHFFFSYNEKGNSKANYFLLVSKTLNFLQTKEKSNGKHLVSVYYDNTDLFKPRELSNLVDDILEKED